MDDTVASTSKPVPLVGDPKLSPTVPMVSPVLDQAVCLPSRGPENWNILIPPG
jgi:hypothetical protein